LGTYGRGFYILDDISPLRELNSDVLASEAHLFTPRSTYRFHSITPIAVEPGSHVTGDNPPYGADIHLYLKESMDEPLQLDVLNAEGRTIRTLDATGSAGINRIWWDLRHEGKREVKLRTPPPGKPWVQVGPEGWRPLVTWSDHSLAPLAPPGIYTVKVTVDDQTMEQTVTVLKDPHSAGTDNDIQTQVALALEIRDSVNEIVDMINHIEWLRKQLGDVQLMLEKDAEATSLIEAANELEEKALAVESVLFDVSLTGPSEDSFRGPMKLYGRLSALGGNLINSGADFPPTDQQVEVYKEYEQQLTEVRAQYQELMVTLVPQFKTMLGTKTVMIAADSPPDG
jgi:hypothetical protein